MGGYYLMARASVLGDEKLLETGSADGHTIL